MIDPVILEQGKTEKISQEKSRPFLNALTAARYAHAYEVRAIMRGAQSRWGVYIKAVCAAWGWKRGTVLPTASGQRPLASATERRDLCRARPRAA